MKSMNTTIANLESSCKRHDDAHNALRNLLAKVDSLPAMPGQSYTVGAITLRFYDNKANPGGSHCHASTKVSIRIDAASH